MDTLVFEIVFKDLWMHIFFICNHRCFPRARVLCLLMLNKDNRTVSDNLGN